MADAGYGEKPWLIVSNNQRNQKLDTVIAARITTTGRYQGLPSVVTLTPADPLTGFVLMDDLEQLDREELTRNCGALCPRTVLAVNDALRIALAIP